METLAMLRAAAAFLAAGCDRNRNRERTGIEDHLKGNTYVSGLDASGPASGTDKGAPPATRS